MDDKAFAMNEIIRATYLDIVVNKWKINDLINEINKYYSSPANKRREKYFNFLCKYRQRLKTKKRVAFNWY